MGRPVISRRRRPPAQAEHGGSGPIRTAPEGPVGCHRLGLRLRPHPDRVDDVERALHAGGAGRQHRGPGRSGLTGSTTVHRHAGDSGQHVDPHGHARPRATQVQLGHRGSGRSEAGHGLETAKEVPRHRLEHGASQFGRSVLRAQADEPCRGVVPPPRGPGTLQPRSGHHSPGTGPAQAGQFGQLLGCAPGEAPEPGHHGPGRGKPAFEQPAVVGRSRQHESTQGPVGTTTDRNRHVGRRAPTDHGTAFGGPRSDHLAGSVAGADDQGCARGQTQLPGRPIRQRAAHAVGGEHRGQPSGRVTRQCIDEAALPVVETATRRHGGIGAHDAGEPPDHEVPRGQDPGAGGQPIGVVSGEPGNFGGHRCRVDGGRRSDRGPSGVCHPGGHRRRLVGSPTV